MAEVEENEEVKDLQNVIKKDLVSVSDLIMTIVKSGHSVSFFQQEGDQDTNYVIHVRVDDNEKTICSFGENGIKECLLIAIKDIMKEQTRERRTRFETLELNW